MKNLDSGRNLGKISISDKIFERSQSWSNISKTSILVEILKNFDFGKIFENYRIWWKFSNNLNFVQNFRKSGFFSNIAIVSILVEIFEKKLELSRNL